jgi:hypothetical protein
MSFDRASVRIRLSGYFHRASNHFVSRFPVSFSVFSSAEASVKVATGKRCDCAFPLAAEMAPGVGLQTHLEDLDGNGWNDVIAGGKNGTDIVWNQSWKWAL